ncbi:recombinase family protein [Rhizobium sp. S163]|uniref:recombinase family protein n=1 Tax=Rhizobium sp. S163 TaxID=3055039 RepID=UPI0025AA13A5|nr:recombinase family protein [Rhizobium sp. S163]MDM9647109.1 recombinase family protein [Rhizobium sp. S163]
MDLASDERPLAFSYVRMSTATQLKGDSLRRQTDASRQYAEDNGLRLVEELEDIGVSAFRGSNSKSGRLAGFLKALDEHDIPQGSFLLVESLDRLSRERIHDALEQFLSILKKGVNIVTLLDKQVYMSGKLDVNQLLVSLIFMSRANEESETKSRRLTAAWNAKRQRIATQKLTRLCPAWMELAADRSHYILDDRKASVVKRIFDDAANGEGSYSITRALNRDGIPPFGRSNFWIKSYVTKILTNRAVLGEYQPHRLIDGKRVAEGDPVHGYFPRVVDDELFYSVQSFRQIRAVGGGGRRGPADLNLFKNVAVCFYCSSPMHFFNKGKGSKGGNYLRCSGAESGSGCCSVAWRYENFEQSFLFFCREIDLLEIAQNTQQKEQKGRRQAQVAKLHTEISDRELQMQKVFSLTQQATSSATYVAGQLDKLQNEIRQRQDEIAELTASRDDQADHIEVDPDEFARLARMISDPAVQERGNLRSLLRSKILRMVDYLRLAPDGGRHNMAWTKPISIDDLPTSPNEYDDFKKVGSMLIEAKVAEPFFQVGFAGDVHRTVRVSSANPLQYTNILEKDGAISWMQSSGEERITLKNADPSED